MQNTVFVLFWSRLDILTMFPSFVSGFATDNIIKVLSGERVGTLFHQDAGSWVSFTEVGAREMAVAARDCSRRLQVNAITSAEILHFRLYILE